jgi:hypothetical protein
MQERPAYRLFNDEQNTHQTKPKSVQFEPPQDQKKRKRPPINLSRQWLIRGAVILVIIAVGALAYGYIHTKNELNKLSNPKTAGQSETQQLISKIGKLVNLPTGETPTLATVNDASKLKTQAFFADAQNGDKVLIYNHAGKAVLYRPSTNKVIAYSRISLNGGQ